MAEYIVFDAHLDGHEAAAIGAGNPDRGAVEYARGMVWSECEFSYNEIAHANLIELWDDVGIYYDYAGDYYFFTNELID